MDWELPDGGPMYYLAMCRSLGRMAGLHKAGNLHPDVNEMFPMPGPTEWHGILPGLDEGTFKMDIGRVDQFVRFVGETAKAVMPDEITDPDFLAQWKKDIFVIKDFQSEIGVFQMGGGVPGAGVDYVGLTHNNLQIDNAFFWRNEQNEVEVGLLDWGVLNCGPLAGAIQGCISGAQVEVLIEHRGAFLQAFIDEYAAN